MLMSRVNDMKSVDVGYFVRKVASLFTSKHCNTKLLKLCSM